MSKKYVNIENLDVERINCFYGSECRLSDVEEWLAELPVEEGLVKVVRCAECIYANDRGNGRYDCPKTNTIHKASYYCADGMRDNMLPFWKKVSLGDNTEATYYKCPYCHNTYRHPYEKCPACLNKIRNPDTKEN